MFDLAGLSGDVTLTVTPGSYPRRSGGIWMTILGGGAFLLGAAFVPLGYAQSGAPSFRQASVATLLAGSAVLASGLALLFTSGTKIRLERRKAWVGNTLARAPGAWMGEL